MVFQIVDDMLDITATDEQLGKPAGHDMVEGVYTLPVLRTLQAGRGAGDGAAGAARQAARRRRARQGAGDRALERWRRLGDSRRRRNGPTGPSRPAMRCRLAATDALRAAPAALVASVDVPA